MYQWVLILGFVVSFVLAFGLGANDVSNAFATSIGSKVISLKSACLIASIAELAGSVALGGFVTEIIRKSTINDGYITSDQEILGMLSSLLTVSIWLILATWLKLPVSTTHSVFSSIIGFLIVQNSAAVNWTKMIEMMIAWIVGPLVSGTLSTICFLGIAYFVLKKDNPYKAGLIAIPYIYVFTLAVKLCFIIYQVFKRLSKRDPSENFSLYIGIAAACAIVICILVFFGTTRYLVPYINKKVRLRLSAQNTEKISSIETEKQDRDDDITRSMSRESIYEYTEHLFSFLQILSAVFTSFAHGSNDVSNSIGPLLALIQAYQRKNEEKVMSSTSPEIYGLLAYGAVGMIVGLYIWGSRVIETMGENLTAICPTRGFAMEFGSAMSVLLASVLGYSVSTTHFQVGSIVAVGWFSHKILIMFSIPDTTSYGSILSTKNSDCKDTEIAKQLSSESPIVDDQPKSRKRMNWRLAFNIVISWVVTIPISGLLSAGIYALLRLTL